MSIPRLLTRLLLSLVPVLLTAQEPRSVIGDLGFAGIALHTNNVPGVRSETVDVSHPMRDTALRVHVPVREGRPHAIQLNVANRSPLAEGDVLLVRLTLRSAGPEGSRVQSHLFVQDRTDNFRSLGNRAVEAGAGWEEIEFLVPIKKAYFRDEVQFSLFLGDAAQTLDVARFEVWNLGARPDDAALARLRSGGQISHDFEGEYIPVPAPPGTRSRISGSLPRGWEEDSSWATVAVNYGATTQNPFKGGKSLRVQVDEISFGKVQFRLPSVHVDPSYQMRIRVATRSPNSAVINLALRQRGEPYRTYWQTTLPAAPEWGVSEVLATSAINDPEAVLMFSIESPAIVEIDELSLTYLTPAQALGNRSFAGNLLPSSSFPLGISSPWARGGNGGPVTAYVADPAVPGPSGLPSLRITPFNDAGRPVGQITAPFEGRPAARHTFSFWARSERAGQTLSIRLGPPEAQIWRAPWSHTVALTREWQRHSFTVELPPAPNGFYLARLNTHDQGVFWVDQLMVEAADSAGEFRRADRVELSAVPAERFGLAFEGRPLGFEVAAHGELSALEQITVTVRDLYGNVRELPPLKGEPEGKLLTLRGELPALDLPPLGSFVLEFTAKDGAGKAISRPAELLLHRVREPRHLGREAPDSAFGTHVFNSREELAMAKALGFNWVRFNYKINWSRVEPRPGEWNWESLDAEFALVRDQQLSVLAYLGGVPPRANVANDSWTGASSWWRQNAAPREDALDDWQEYARRVLERYGPVLRAVEVWNEPFLPGFFVADVRQGVPVRASAELYHQMTARVRAAATEAGYTGRLLWNLGAAYGESQVAFDRRNVELGTADLVDGFTLHRYTNAPLGFPGDQFAQDMKIYREVLGKHAERGALWNSEGGFGLSEVFNLLRHAPPANHRARADLQAGNLVRYYLSNFAAGVERVFIYSFFPPDAWVSDYSYLNVDGSLSHTAPAISNLAWQLEGRRFVRAVALGDEVQAMLFSSGEGDPAPVVALLSRGVKPVRLTGLPEGVVAHDVYGNPATLPTSLGVGVHFVSGKGLQPEALSAHLSVAP